MMEQIEKRIAALRVTLQQRITTVAECERALELARYNRDRVDGGITELEYALEHAEPIKDDTIKGQIPAAGK